METNMNLDNKEAKEEALGAAAKSPCHKRKVGAVITNASGDILSAGHNHNCGNPCEDENGKTFDDVTHAEIAAINWIPAHILEQAAIIYVTHEPCKNCAQAIKDAGIIHTVVVEEFMKFDTSKLRYSLIPPSATKALAEVLTYGAKKYKPNNWQLVDDKTRYVDALYRHLDAWRAGEKFDEESGLSHLAHAMTNVAFLNHLDD